MLSLSTFLKFNLHFKPALVYFKISLPIHAYGFRLQATSLKSNRTEN